MNCERKASREKCGKHRDAACGVDYVVAIRCFHFVISAYQWAHQQTWPSSEYNF